MKISIPKKLIEKVVNYFFAENEYRKTKFVFLPEMMRGSIPQLEEVILKYLQDGIALLIDEYIEKIDVELIKERGITELAEDFYFDSGVLYGWEEKLVKTVVPTLEFATEDFWEEFTLHYTLGDILKPLTDVFEKYLVKDKRYTQKMK